VEVLRFRRWPTARDDEIPRATPDRRITLRASRWVGPTKLTLITRLAPRESTHENCIRYPDTSVAGRLPSAIHKTLVGIELRAGAAHGIHRANRSSTSTTRFRRVGDRPSRASVLMNRGFF